jgi:hypothetical protein
MTRFQDKISAFDATQENCEACVLSIEEPVAPHRNLGEKTYGRSTEGKGMERIKGCEIIYMQEVKNRCETDAGYAELGSGILMWFFEMIADHLFDLFQVSPPAFFVGHRIPLECLITSILLVYMCSRIVLQVLFIGEVDSCSIRLSLSATSRHSEIDRKCGPLKVNMGVRSCRFNY